MISVIMPVYNEEKTITKIIRQVLEQDIGELIVVDDGSSDETWMNIAVSGLGCDPRLKVICSPHNYGKGHAIRQGLKICNGQWVIIQDADLEYDPQDYNFLFREMVKGFEVVLGYRRNLKGWHRATNRFLTDISNLFTGLRINDMETGMKAFNRSVLEGLNLKENGFGFEPEFIAAVKRRKIAEVPIHYQARSRAEGKKIKFRHGIEAVWCILKYNIF